MNTVSAVIQVPNRSRILSQAVIEAAKRMKVGPTDLGLIVGFSQPTSSRLLHGKFFIPEGSKVWELSAQFVRLYRSLSSLVGGTMRSQSAGLNLLIKPSINEFHLTISSEWRV